MTTYRLELTEQVEEKEKKKKQEGKDLFYFSQ